MGIEKIVNFCAGVVCIYNMSKPGTFCIQKKEKNHLSFTYQYTSYKSILIEKKKITYLSLINIRVQKKTLIKFTNQISISMNIYQELKCLDNLYYYKRK